MTSLVSFAVLIVCVWMSTRLLVSSWSITSEAPVTAFDGGIELNIESAQDGPTLQGSTVQINCFVNRLDLLDIVRLVRHPFADDSSNFVTSRGGSDVISTNGVVQGRFKDTGRYKVIQWSQGRGLLQLQITDVMGEDSGYIGCHQFPGDGSVFVPLHVYVPPTSVQLGYSRGQTNDGVLYANDEVIKLSSLPAILSCDVIVPLANHVVAPDVTLWLDDVDVTSQFARSTTSQDGAGDHVTLMTWNLTLTQLYDVHAANLTCSAEMPHYPPLVHSANVYVFNEPVINCSQANESLKLGHDDLYHRITFGCSGRVYPPADVVIWTHFGDDVIVIASSDVTDNFTQQMSETEQPVYAVHSFDERHQYNFLLHFDNVTLDDLDLPRRYDLQVSNNLGTTLSSVYLMKQLADEETTTTTEANDVSSMTSTLGDVINVTMTSHWTRETSVIRTQQPSTDGSNYSTYTSKSVSSRPADVSAGQLTSSVAMTTASLIYSASVSVACLPTLHLLVSSLH